MLEDLTPAKGPSLKEIFEKVKYYLLDIFSKWYVVLLSCLIGGVAAGYYAYSSDHFYEADYSYVIKTAGGGSGINPNDILASLGWGGGQGAENMEKVKTILYSKSLLTEALYDSVEIDSKKDLLVNHIAHIYEYDKRWSKNENLHNFSKFEISRKYLDTSIEQNSAFMKILSLIRGSGKGGIVTVRTEPNIDKMNINVRSLNEKLSYHLAISIYNSLNNFYLEEGQSANKKAIRSLKNEADSVSRLLKSKEYQLANARDRNYGIILSKNQVNQEDIQRDIQILTAVYGQMRQNLEMSQFGLKNTSSKFDVLEHPVLPLSKKTKKPLVYALIGILIGLGASLVILLLRRFLLDELK